ncbi:MAG: glycosyltransferase [Coriobacteriia bacterium]|nr:glycosyltransferase [Coriobacteriia bacterium]
MEGKSCTMTAAPAALLSVVVPVYNALEHLADCIDSILGQSFGDLEVLLVDDGSTDGSSELCDEYTERDSRVRVFHRKNGGPSAARNCGLSAAVGQYVQFVDSDDLLRVDACALLVRAIEEAGADLVVCQASVVDASMREIAQITTPAAGLYAVEDLLRSLGRTSKATLLHYVWNKCYRMSVVESAGLEFDESVSLGEDFLFNSNYWKACSTVRVIENSLYMYCSRDSVGLSELFRQDELDRRRLMDQELVSLYSRHGLLEQNQDKLAALFGMMALTSMSMVTLPGCHLSILQKRAYLVGFVESEYREYIRAYRTSGTASRWEQVRCRLAEAGALWGLLLWLEGIHRVKGVGLRRRR